MLAAIVAMSLALLKVQIEVLRPAYLVFATGASCDRYLRCLHDRLGDGLPSERLLPGRLWRFGLSLHDPALLEKNAAIAVRIPHPRDGPSAPLRQAILAELAAPGRLDGWVRDQHGAEGAPGCGAVLDAP